MNRNSRLQIINWTNVYKNYTDDITFLQDVFYEFKLEILNEIKELSNFILLQDYEKIYLISHKMKGTLFFYYCEESGDIMEDICFISKKGINDPSQEKILEIEILFDEFYKNFESVKYEIDSHLFKKK